MVGVSLTSFIFATYIHLADDLGMGRDVLPGILSVDEVSDKRFLG